MPMIDVYAPAGLLPTAAAPALLQRLAKAVVHAEGNPDRSPYAENTAAFLHEVPATAVATAAGPATAVRVDVRTPPGAFTREAQQAVVADITRMVGEAAGDPTLTGRTWVVLAEAAEGGWGVAGHALGRAEIAAARAAAIAASVTQ